MSRFDSVLIANRALPSDLPQRGDWQEYLFWAAWVLAMAHAFWRTAPVLQARIAPAWREQSWVIAGLAVLAVLLNWATTGDHLLRTLASGYWPVAGLELALLATAACAVLAARKLRQRELGAAPKQVADAANIDAPSDEGAARA